MAFFTIQQLFDPAFIPPNAVDRVSLPVARAVAEALRQGVNQNPQAFLLPPGEYETGGDYSPTARAMWEEWAGGALPVPVEIPAPDTAVGVGYTYSLTTTWFNTLTGQEFEDKTGLANPSTDPNVAWIYGPITRGFYFQTTPDGFQAVYARGRDANGNPVEQRASTNWNQLYIFKGIKDAFFSPTGGVSPIAIPEALRYPSPAPIIVAPQIPLPVRVPGGIPQRPNPVIIPYILPTPHVIPIRPVPLLPGTPPRPALPPVPEITVFPDGITVATPSGGLQRPGYGLNRPPQLSQEQQEEQRRRIGEVPCLPDIEPPSDCCDCEEIREIVIEELDNKFPPKRPTTTATQSRGCFQSGTVQLPPYTRSVTLSVCEFPENSRRQSGGPSGPDVYYLGWYSFGAGGRPGERLPVHYLDMTVFPPENADTFTYTMYDGVTAELTIRYTQGAD